MWPTSFDKENLFASKMNDVDKTYAFWGNNQQCHSLMVVWARKVIFAT